MGTTQLSTTQTAMSLEKFCKSPLLKAYSMKKNKNRAMPGKGQKGVHKGRPSTASKVSSSMPSISISSSESSMITPQYASHNNHSKRHIPKKSMTERILDERPMSSGTNVRRKRSILGVKRGGPTNYFTYNNDDGIMDTNVNILLNSCNRDKRVLLSSPHTPVKQWQQVSY